MPEFNDNLNDFKNEINRNSKDHTDEFSSEDIRNNSALAAVSYIPILFVLPLILRPNSTFARFHANQGLILLIVEIVLGAVVRLISFIPLISLLANTVCGLVMFAYFLYGFVNTLNGKAKDLPFIGGIRFIK